VIKSLNTVNEQKIVKV